MKINAILAKAKSYGIAIDKSDQVTYRILRRVEELENMGYQFETADASFELLIRTEIGEHKPYFNLRGFKVITQEGEPGQDNTKATIKVTIGDKSFLEAAECIGPVSALDRALRKALVKVYPQISNFCLTDYEVRILNPEAGTAGKTQALVELSNGNEYWSTVGVSVDILKASYEAIVSGIEYGLYRHF